MPLPVVPVPNASLNVSATLDKCRSEGEAAIICCHVPILPESAIPSCLLWNFQDILHLIHKHNSSCSAAHGRVVSIFSGHFHGGRTVSDSGILYVSLKSPLLSPHAYYSVSHSPSLLLCHRLAVALSSCNRWNFMRIA